MVCGFSRYKAYVDIRRGSLVRWCQMRVRSSKMRVFCFDRCIFRTKFPTGFAYRNLHCFAQFPGDSGALVKLAHISAVIDCSISLVAVCNLIANQHHHAGRIGFPDYISPPEMEQARRPSSPEMHRPHANSAIRRSRPTSDREKRER